jgi:uncharacterized protein (DUF1501 family)
MRSKKTNPQQGGWSRRQVLETAGLAMGAVTLRSVLWPSRALAAGPNPSKYLLFCYFSGGWDQLLALDPRDQTDPSYSQAKAYASGGSGIYPAYDLVQDADTKALLAANPSGVQKPAGGSSPLTFGPAIPSSLLAHAQDFCVLRGINMGTLTHEVGRRYYITGKFPRGLQASGSALPTAVAAQTGDKAEIPNLTVGVETYNEGMPAFASGLQVTSASDVQNILRLGGKAVPAGTDAALLSYEASADSCDAHELDGGGLVSLFRASRVKARELVTSGASSHFAFVTDPTKQTQEIKDLFAAFGIATAADLAGPKGQAALGAQALTQGVSQVISLQLASGIDDHDSDWSRNHAADVRRGFDALGQLIAYLKNAPDVSGGSFWDHTTLMAFSEFSRTPLVNGRGGRDHHLCASTLLAGPGVKGNTVVGASSNRGMAFQAIDLQTGMVDAVNGVPVRPADVHATLLTSMGLSYAHIMNQSPVIVRAALK